MWLYLLACGGGSDTGEPKMEAPDTVTLGGRCPSEQRFGGFLVESYDTYAQVYGTVADGVVPSAILTEVGREGDCVLYQRQNPFCDPTCAVDEACSLASECVPYPVAQSLGTVTVAGLVSYVEIEPVEPGFIYFDISLPNPPFEAGANVGLSTGGGSFAAVALTGQGGEPLVIPAQEWVVSAGADLSLSWTPPTIETLATIFVELNVDQHGVSPYLLQCSFADTGAGVVPASLTATLVSAGVSGFPNGRIGRQTADSASVGDGCMDLIVGSLLNPDVRVEGHTPCYSDLECPEGQTCDETIQTCE